VTATMTAPPDATDVYQYMAQLSEAGHRAVDWVLARRNPDGSLGNVNDGFKYHRAPWTFALYGRSDAGHSICGWMRRTLLTPDMTLGGPPRLLLDGWSYRDSCVIIGAQMLHQHDLSIGLMPELLRYQDPVSGGFANDRMPDGSMSDEMDIPYACGPGFACLLTGQLDEARRVADFLQAIYDAQDELPDRFYCFWSRSRQAPIRPGEPGFQRRFVVANQENQMQRWTIGGIAAGFLGRLYLADPQERYLTLARAYQSFSMAATDDQFSYPSACKSSWGASLLYQITGEPQYLAWLGRFARWYIDSQEPDGFWHPWVEKSQGDIIEITLEYAMHIAILTGAVSSRPVASVRSSGTA
jgi:hypothetical protein